MCGLDLCRARAIFLVCLDLPGVYVQGPSLCDEKIEKRAINKKDFSKTTHSLHNLTISHCVYIRENTLKQGTHAFVLDQEGCFCMCGRSVHLCYGRSRSILARKRLGAPELLPTSFLLESQYAKIKMI